MIKSIKTYLLIFTILLCYVSGFSQVSLTGPTCVVPGITYQYRIQGNWDSTSTMQVCLSNGVIADSTGSSTCTPAAGAPLSTVLVIWSPGSNGSLSLKSKKGNSSISVKITSGLFAGGIDSVFLLQRIFKDSIPTSINCSPAGGGSCNPVYSYQWQQSLNNVSWSDIVGATGPNLSFGASVSQTTFFRRKVTETASGSISYSNAAVVDVLIKY
jgi:hypothetical protein